MPHGPVRTDLGLLDQGIEVGLQYGVHSLVELARMAEMLLHSVYEPGSLRREDGRATFTLRNPPLRMGAFRAIELFWDGVPVPPGSVTIASSGEPPRPLEGVDREHPVTIPVGRRTVVRMGAVEADAHPHVVRLELHSVAIPPTVWYEFRDVLHEGKAP